MGHRNPKRTRQPCVADEIMVGMRELSRMMDEGKTPEQMFTVKTIEVPEPGDHQCRVTPDAKSE